MEAECILNVPTSGLAPADNASISAITFLPLKVNWDPVILNEPVRFRACAPGISRVCTTPLWRKANEPDNSPVNFAIYYFLLLIPT